LDQVIQLLGALLILAGFIAAQAGRVSPHAPSYVVLNFVGSVILAYVALDSRNWGFLLLEAVWAIVSLWALIQIARGRPPRQTSSA
jgi:uncharacterized protein YqgC (DUF456 family)